MKVKNNFSDKKKALKAEKAEKAEKSVGKIKPKKKVNIKETLNQTYTYVKNTNDQIEEEKSNEFSLKQRELYKKDINDYLLSKVYKTKKPDYYYIIDEYDIEGYLFLYISKDKINFIFFHDAELEFKIIPFEKNIELSNTCLDFFFKNKLNELINALNDIDEYFHIDKLFDKIK